MLVSGASLGLGLEEVVPYLATWLDAQGTRYKDGDLNFPSRSQ